ncbi:MAG: zinc metalloprotease HtpX [Deltaproteobacteria bacterium]|nr:MAG: zinc metalloprotease HtpX [Deltaproteobacteria bacterium]
MNNQIRTTLLLAAMTVFLVLIGRMLGGRQGMIFAFIMAVGMNFFSYWFSDKMVLKMYRAQEVSPDEASELYEIVQTIARRANVPMPKIFIIPKEAPNAFATGRNPAHAVVAVSQGLLEVMNRDELTGVLAHEMAHVKNRDILIGSIAATMAGAVMILANMARFSAIFGGGRDSERGGGIGLLIMSILAPFGAMIIQMAVSRSREYLADATGARFAGSPEGLASALEKLGAYSGRIPMNASPATAHMFIVNPLSGRSMTRLFSTHPPLEERIARLRGMRRAGNQPQTSPISENSTIDRGRSEWDRLSK